jgi:hypothetical protein
LQSNTLRSLNESFEEIDQKSSNLGSSISDSGRKSPNINGSIFSSVHEIKVEEFADNDDKVLRFIDVPDSKILSTRTLRFTKSIKKNESAISSVTSKIYKKRMNIKKRLVYLATLEFVPNKCKKACFFIWYILILFMIVLTAINSTYNPLDWRDDLFP